MAIAAGMIFPAGPLKVRAHEHLRPPSAEQTFSGVDRDGSEKVKPGGFQRVAGPLSAGSRVPSESPKNGT